MTDFVIKSGSTAPALTATLYDGLVPLNLTGATVQMRMRAVSGGALVINAPAVITGDPTEGVVVYQWLPADTDDVGEFEVEWEVTFSGGAEQVFPTQGYTTVTVEPSLTAEATLLPALPDLCWPVDHGCCDEFDNYSAEVRARADALASQTMRMLTGYSVGGCPVLLRPCSVSCVSGSPSWGWVGSTFTPFINTLGQWVNGCGCSSDCACSALSTVRLGSYGTVTQVKIDGAALAPTAYRVQNGTSLVRLDGGTWPSCQDMAAEDTEIGTFSVTVQRGAPVDGLAAAAAGRLACEYAKACIGKKCALPSNVTNVTRAGISYDMSTEAFPGGLTGIREVDLVIRRYNPHGLKMPSMVYSPDLPSAVVPQ